MSLRPTFKKEEARAGCGIRLAVSNDPLWSTSSPANPSVGAASVNFSFASPAVAEDQSSIAMEGVSDLKLSPEYLRHQPDDQPSLIWFHNQEIIIFCLSFMLLKQVLRSVNNNQRWFYVLHEKSLSLSLPSTPSNSSSIHNSLIWTYLLCNKYSLSLLFTRLPW